MSGWHVLGAVLRALRDIIDKGREHGKPVTLCGEMGATPLGALALVALGYRNLSVSPSALGPVKAMLLETDAGEVGELVRGLLSSRAPRVSVREQLAAYAAAEGLPGIEEGVSYGTPALKVGKKLLCRIKDADTVVVMCPIEEKELLMEAAPELYFETDHYKGWPTLLVRIHDVPLDELGVRLKRAWVMQAPKSLLKQFGRSG